MTLDDIETAAKIRIIAIQTIEGETFIGHHSVERSTTIQPQMALGVLTTKEHLDAFVQGFHLDLSDTIEKFSNLLSTQECGTANAQWLR
jgi:hypothetical protein